jgi:hypothetical protein
VSSAIMSVPQEGHLLDFGCVLPPRPMKRGERARAFPPPQRNMTYQKPTGKPTKKTQIMNGMKLPELMPISRTVLQSRGTWITQQSSMDSFPGK